MSFSSQTEALTECLLASVLKIWKDVNACFLFRQQIHILLYVWVYILRYMIGSQLLKNVQYINKQDFRASVAHPLTLIALPPEVFTFCLVKIPLIIRCQEKMTCSCNVC